MLDSHSTRDFVERFWDAHIVPTLVDYIRMPNKSPAFDPDWEAHGHMEDVLQLALRWLEQHPIPGATVEVGRLPGRTPLILVDCPGDLDSTVLMYGHLDKQPEMSGWDEGFGPWIPRIVDGKLYLNLNPAIGRRWAKDIPGFIARADANWPGVLE